jgi:hypothetical protein
MINEAKSQVGRSGAGAFNQESAMTLVVTCFVPLKEKWPISLEAISNLPAYNVIVAPSSGFGVGEHPWERQHRNSVDSVLRHINSQPGRGFIKMHPDGTLTPVPVSPLQRGRPGRGPRGTLQPGWDASGRFLFWSGSTFA